MAAAEVKPEAKRALTRDGQIDRFRHGAADNADAHLAVPIGRAASGGDQRHAKLAEPRIPASVRGAVPYLI